MNNDWKPTEQNIGQPVLDTYIPSIGTSHIYSKWYDVDTTKLTSIKDVEAVFSAVGMKVSETNENFDKVKHRDTGNIRRALESLPDNIA